jgi:hypothetical protein
MSRNYIDTRKSPKRKEGIRRRNKRRASKYRKGRTDCNLTTSMFSNKRIEHPKERKKEEKKSKGPKRSHHYKRNVSPNCNHFTHKHTHTHRHKPFLHLKGHHRLDF